MIVHLLTHYSIQLAILYKEVSNHSYRKIINSEDILTKVIVMFKVQIQSFFALKRPPTLNK